MLEGFDKEWVDAGSRRVAYYTNIPPGSYRFRVIACNSDGVWNELGASFYFDLAPRFYQTFWFYLLCASALALMAVASHRLRIRQLKVREKELACRVEDRTSQLNEQRAFLRQVIDLNPSLIFAKDREGRFTLANQALAETYGTTVENLLGKTDAQFARNKEDEHFRRDDLEVMNDLVEKFIPEEIITDATGNTRWLQTIKRPIVSLNGTASQILGVATDITERKQAAEELRKAKETAEEATRAKSEFLANMSHEIRTPMNAVIGLTGLLLDTRLDSEQQEFVEIIRTSGDSLLTIINDILDFSKIESGKLELEQQPFNLTECIENMLDLIASQAAEKGIELCYTVDDDIPDTIIGDVTRLRQILLNLVNNAVKFTHEGEVVITVTAKPIEECGNLNGDVASPAPHPHTLTDSSALACELHFAVKDTGIGIPEEDMNRLFRSFSQVDSSTTRTMAARDSGSPSASDLQKSWVEVCGSKANTVSAPLSISRFAHRHFQAILTSISTLSSLSFQESRC